MTLYVNLAELLGSRIENGFYRPGDRLPSVRALSLEHGVSLSTVQQAYRLLEDNGLAAPKPKSGYFVPAERKSPALPVVTRPAQRPVDISQWDQVLDLISAVPTTRSSSWAGACQTSTARPCDRYCVHWARSAAGRTCLACITTISAAPRRCAIRWRACCWIRAATSPPTIW